MKRLCPLFVFLLLVIPIFVDAQCSKENATVLFINGIFGNEALAKLDLKQLNYEFEHRSNTRNISFINGYNASHGEGAIDLVEAAVQMYKGGTLDYDLTNILRQVHQDLKTQKILLVGHSQGSFYTNAAYNYLIQNGVDDKSIAVYNVGTPADRVAGGGNYLTSSTDKIINSVAQKLATIAIANKPLPANIKIEIPTDRGPGYENGHSFSKVYLGLEPDKIITDIDNAIKNLTANNDKEECFAQPKLDTMYRVFDKGYQLADNVAEIASEQSTGFPGLIEDYGRFADIGNSILQNIYNFGKNITSSVANAFENAWVFGSASLSSVFTQNNTNYPVSTNSGTNINLNYPSNVNDDEPEITFLPAEEPKSQQDILDDIQEQLDIIQRQLSDLLDQQEQDDLLDKEEQEDEKKEDNGKQYINYPKILISEIQINPTAERFIELYNPNSSDVPLTGWYLQRKDSNDDGWSSCISSTNFSGKTIPANGYFLISREITNSNILYNMTLSIDNSLALKNPNGEISDKVGFGNAIDYESSPTINPSASQSIGRKSNQDTDNNYSDFELNTPTPKAQNSSLVASNNTKIISTVYNIDENTFTIKSVATGTPKNDFKSNIIKDDSAQTWDDSNIFDPVANGDKLIVTAQDGITKATYIITVDNAPDTIAPIIVNYSITNTIISPDGDSIDDETEIDLKFSEKVSVDMDIISSIGNKIKDLYNSSAVTDPQPKIWSGKDNSDITVMGGVYTVKITIADMAGNSITDMSKSITVDGPIIGSDATVSSTIYNVSAVQNGLGTITNVPLDTTKEDFLNNLIKNEPNQTWDDSNISDPVANGDKLIVTAQDGITTTSYDISSASSNNFTISPACTFSSPDVYNEFGRVWSVVSMCNCTSPEWSSTIADYGINMKKNCGWNSHTNQTCPIISFHQNYNHNDIWTYQTVYIINGVCSLTPFLTDPVASSDATIISDYYEVSDAVEGEADIGNLPFGITKEGFLNNLIKNEPNQTWDDSNISDPVANGDKLIVTAQDGITKVTYTIYAPNSNNFSIAENCTFYSSDVSGAFGHVWSVVSMCNCTAPEWSDNISNHGINMKEKCGWNDSMNMTCSSVSSHPNWNHTNVWTYPTVYVVNGSCYSSPANNPITIQDIPNIRIPVIGASPITSVDTPEYTANISWIPDDLHFVGDTSYTAKIKINPKSGYTTLSLPENFFTVAGTSEPATNSAGSSIVTAIFPTTAPTVAIIPSTNFTLTQDCVFSSPDISHDFGNNWCIMGWNVTGVNNCSTGGWSDTIRDSGINMKEKCGWNDNSSGTAEVVFLRSGTSQGFSYSGIYLENGLCKVTPQDTDPPTIDVYEISLTTISPNGDGIDDETEIDLKFSEKVSVDMDIVDSSDNLIKNLYHSDGVTNPQPKIWDGKDNLDVVVANGVYTIKIVFTDLAGNSVTDTSQTITVDASTDIPDEVPAESLANDLAYIPTEDIDIPDEITVEIPDEIPADIPDEAIVDDIPDTS